MARKAVVAVIPARGGSKRLPRKNILPLDGKPLLAHAIGHAMSAGVFTHVVVSTEDAEIAGMARGHGALLHERSEALATDRSRIRDVCLAVLDEMFGDDESVEAFCVLTPTAALRTPEDIVESLAILRGGYDFVTSVCRYFFYPHGAMYVDDVGAMRHWHPELSSCQGQQVPDFFVENGAVNWCRPRAFRAVRELLGPNAWFHMMPHYRSIDVDTPDDWIALQAMYAFLRGRGR